MSKMDGLRAMREARYEQARKRGGSPATAPKAPTAPVAARPAAKRTPAPEPAVPPAGEAQAGEALCGHRNMSGRTCTREHGHAAKSHRYS
jgi:hypothetical protein